MVGRDIFRLIVARCALTLAALLSLPIATGQAETSACADPISAIAMPRLELSAEEIRAIDRLYTGRGNRCAWTFSSEASLRAILARSAEEGLDPERYHPDAIQPAREARSRDVAATAMALRYAHDMTFGRVDLAGVDDDVDIPRPRIDLAAGLGDAMDRGTLTSWLDALEPSDPAYHKLVSALAFYRGIANRGGWPLLPAGPTLNLGKSDPRVELLKQRLAAVGDLKMSDPGPLFDQPTERAVQSFQDRHGLIADGRVGRNTLAALNVSVNARLDQILANLERWRALARALPASGVTVNTAAATAVLTEDNRPVLSMRAIVGDSRHPTPMLLSRIDAVILNPPWIVPRSIIRNEIEPALRRDPSYLERNRMRWIGDQLVQTPGDKNSLGRIKFVLPNPFSVYMHDTPARALFAQDMRARSHGCVRLERPLDLAVEVLKADSAWSHDRLVAAIAQGATVRIRVPTPVPVAFVYWTAFVDGNGIIQFRNDLYGRDARLTAALESQSVPRAAVRAAQTGCTTG